jgi:putative transposase
VRNGEINDAATSPPYRFMSTPRKLASKNSPAAVYHVWSQIHDKALILNEVDRSFLVKLMRKYEAFCQVEVVTYCVMANRFDILVRVPKRPVGFDLSVSRVIELLEDLAGPQSTEEIRQRLRRYRANGDRREIEVWRKRQLRRMFSLGHFMKGLKTRFAVYYNVANRHEGTLWEAVYKSVLIHEATPALPTAAAAIDLKPVRAGIVDDPSHYRWSGFGEAMRGGSQAQEALQKLIQTAKPKAEKRRLAVKRAKRRATDA